MVEASKGTKFSDLSYGDETRRNGDYVGLPHDQDQSETDSDADNNVLEGQAVHIDAQGNIAAADAGETVVGVLYTYDYFGDSGGPDDPGTIDQDQNATVKTKGTVKAEVESDVSAGDALEAGVTTSGVFDLTGDTSSPEQSNFVALSDAVEDERADGDPAHYAEVLLR